MQNQIKLNKYSRMQLNQLKRIKEQIEARETRTKSIALRKHILQKQNVMNYQSEYERLLGELENSAVPGSAKYRTAKERLGKLEKLGVDIMKPRGIV